MNEIMSALTDGVLRYLVAGSVAALVLVLLALASLKIGRIALAVYRHLVWLYCLIGIAGLPLILLHGPRLTLAILPAGPGTRGPSLALPAGGRPGIEESRPAPADLPTDAGPRESQDRVASWSVPSWKVGAAAVWLLGFSLE
jgi:hypothetical protein